MSFASTTRISSQRFGRSTRRLGRSNRKRLALLFALLTTQLGGVCDGLPEGDPGAAPASFLIVPSNVSLSAGDVFSIDVRFDTIANVQAIDLSVQWDPAHISYVSISPHPDFDDDGQLFSSVIVDESSGSIQGIRDSRHGDSAVSGQKGIVTLQFRVESSQSSTIDVGGQIADEFGLLSHGLVAKCNVNSEQI